jgi:hypothetical protein
MSEKNRTDSYESKKPKSTASKRIAYLLLTMTFVTNMGVLFLCGLSVWKGFTGALPYLTTMIGLLEFSLGYVLGHYYKKSTAENTAGGIVYDTAVTNTRRDI